MRLPSGGKQFWGQSSLSNHNSGALVSHLFNGTWVEDLWSQVVPSPSLLVLTKQLSLISRLFVCAINGIIITAFRSNILTATSFANVTMGSKEDMTVGVIVLCWYAFSLLLLLSHFSCTHTHTLCSQSRAINAKARSKRCLSTSCARRVGIDAAC